MRGDPTNQAQVHLRQRAKECAPGSVVWVDPHLLARSKMMLYGTSMMIGGVHFKPFELQDADGRPYEYR